MRGDFVVPGFQVEGLLGAAPTGEVWLATEQASQQQVALKRLRVEPTDGPAAVRRLVATLGHIGHEHLLPIRRVADDGGALVLVCDYAASGSLGQLLNARAQLDPGETVTTIGPVAEALAAVHAHHLVHGDITPENIVFTGDGRPLLADTALLAITASTDALAATHGYTDPTVICGAPPSSAADVYGLAAAAWAALTGTPPQPPGRPALLSVRPGVPAGLAHAIESGLQAGPEVRPSAAQFADMVYAAAPPAPVRFPIGLAITDPSGAGGAGGAGRIGAGESPRPGGGPAVTSGWGAGTDRSPKPATRPAASPAVAPPVGPTHGDAIAASGARKLPKLAMLVGAAAFVVVAALVAGGVLLVGHLRKTPPVAGSTQSVSQSAHPSTTPGPASTPAPSVFTPPVSGAQAFGRWGTLLDGLLVARSKMFFDANPAELGNVFTTAGKARTAEVRKLAALPPGAHVEGLRMKVLALRVANESDTEVVLDASTRTEGFAVVGRDGSRVQDNASPALDGPIILRKNAAGQWRIFNW